MRLLLILLTLALLPLRGWATNMEAPKPVPAAAHAINNIANQSIPTRAETIFHPENQTTPDPCTEPAHAAHPGLAHGLCQASACCAVCHAVLALPQTGAASGLGRASPVRAAGPSRFASAPAALLLKPPIA